MKLRDGRGRPHPDWKKGGPSPCPTGRPRGSTSKVSKTLKEAILLAAELSGSNKKGKDGLVGYLLRVANTDVRAFVSLLGRVLPLQVQAQNSHTHAHTSHEEILEALQNRGLRVSIFDPPAIVDGTLVEDPRHSVIDVTPGGDIVDVRANE